MAKLYWRIKRNGKWTWIAATPENTSWDLESFPFYDPTYQQRMTELFDRCHVDKPEVDHRAVEEEVCFACETVGEEHCNVHRPYE